MYSGDEVYSDEITSGPNTSDPLGKQDEHPLNFKAWMKMLRQIVRSEIGCTLDDLEDFSFYDAYEDGYSPRTFFEEEIKPEVDSYAG